MITTPKDEIIKGRDHCPWQMFFAAFFLKEEKGFSKPEEVTPYLAIAKYLFKNIIFQECESQSSMHRDFDE